MRLSVRLTRAAAGEIDDLESDLRESILHEIFDLAEDPFPPGHIVMRRAKNLYRIRAEGNYRVIYRVPPDRKEVIVVRIQRRDVVYRGFDRR